MSSDSRLSQIIRAIKAREEAGEMVYDLDTFVTLKFEGRLSAKEVQKLIQSLIQNNIVAQDGDGNWGVLPTQPKTLRKHNHSFTTTTPDLAADMFGRFTTRSRRHH